VNLLIDSALKATLLLTVAWIATLALRRASADVRHRIWLAALLGVALLPVLAVLAPTALPPAMRITITTGGATTPARSLMRGLPVLSATWLGIVWSIGVGLVLVRLAVGVMRAAVLTRAARPTLRAGVMIAESAATPMTWGLFRPVILLPAYAEQWSDDQLEPVLNHERAHIERRDWLAQMFTRLMTAVFCFHPLVWVAAAMLRREAECAADDRVIASGVFAPDYASQLLEVASRMSGHAPFAAVGMTRGSKVERRVIEVLDTARRRSPAGRWTRIAVTLACGALVLPLAAMQQRSRDERGGGQVYKIGGDVKSPRLLYKVEPEYSESARTAKLQGAVVLNVVVSEEGRAENIVVHTSLEEGGLDQKAVEAVQQWIFDPGTRDGQPVAVYATIEINFRLM
jgi:TonB family protein